MLQKSSKGTGKKGTLFYYSEFYIRVLFLLGNGKNDLIQIFADRNGGNTSVP